MTRISGFAASLAIASDRISSILTKKTEQVVAVCFNRERPNQVVAYAVAVAGMASSYALQRNHPYLASGGIVLSIFYLSYASLPKGLFIPPLRLQQAAAPAA